VGTPEIDRADRRGAEAVARGADGGVGGAEARMMQIVPWTGPLPRVRLLWRLIRRLLGGLPLQHYLPDTVDPRAPKVK